jgi:hypothetical protein
MGRRNAPRHHEGGGETHPTPPRHAVFFQQEAPHAPPKRLERLPHASAWDAHADNFFLIYSIQIPNCPWFHTILTKKTLKKGLKTSSILAKDDLSQRHLSKYIVPRIKKNKKQKHPCPRKQWNSTSEGIINITLYY